MLNWNKLGKRSWLIIHDKHKLGEKENYAWARPNKKSIDPKHRNGEKRYILLFNGIIIRDIIFFQYINSYKNGKYLTLSLSAIFKWFVYEIGNNKLGLQENLETDH